ncbi:hypothetical protein [Flavobacterium sp. U410]
MGYYLEYITVSSEKELLSKISNNDKELEYDKIGILEGKFKESKYDFSFNIYENGILNICYPKIKYSWIVNKLFDADRIVLEIDKEIIKFFPNNTIFRIDEFIREEFEKHTNSKILAEEYLKQLNLYLKKEDSNYWKKL